MPLPHIWLGRALHPEALTLFDGIATVSNTVVGELADWHAEAREADAIVVGGNATVDAAAMDQVGSRLRIIARTGIGVDRIDLEAATERGILVLNTPDGPTESTAEHAIALLLNLCKQVMAGDRVLRSGAGFPRYGTLPIGLETLGAVLGLVGLGRIGSRVAIIARTLGMRVLAFDPFVAPERAAEMGVELLPSLEELLPRANVVSLHCPSIPATRHIINERTLALMKRDSYLINVSRGALIDEAALLIALQAGQLAGAALDVFDPEPPLAENPLFKLPNTICTPHIGSYTFASTLRMQMMACQQVILALRNERPPDLVNPLVWGHHRQ